MREVSLLLKLKKHTLMLLTIMLIFYLILNSTFVVATSYQKDYLSFNNEEVTYNFKELVKSISIDNILQHANNLARLGTRVTGTQGCKQAADYIYNYLESLTGVEVIRQEYNVTLPIDRGASISVLDNGDVILAHPLWPNFVQTCRTPIEGLEGRLVYVGNGEYADFNEKFTPGDIVLMDFNTGNNWQKAAELGAKAVIFIEPPTTNYYEELQKFSQTPVHFPRVFVSIKDGLYLKALAQRPEGVRVNIKLDMRYEYTKSENIIATIKGDPGNPSGLSGVDEEIIIIGAHYDSWSVVPAIAPGADESTGISTLLELARYFSIHHPRRSIWFVALSGHWQALAGAREFVEKYYFANEIVGGNKVIWMYIDLDFSTDSNKVGLVFVGHMYKIGSGPEMYWCLPKYDTWITPTISKYLPVMEQQLSLPFTRLVENSLRADWWWATIPTPYILDSESFSVAGGAGFTLRTTDTYRAYWGIFDTPEKISKENLEPQVQLAACLVYIFANEPEVKSASTLKQMLKPQRLYVALGGVATGAGFNTLVGKVWTYNISKGWYDNVPYALVHVRSASPFYPFTSIIQFADKNGTFEIHGLGPGLTAGIGQHQRVLQSYYVEAFHINDSTGLIDYAPDLGIYGAQTFNFWALMASVPASVTTVVFKCSSVTMFNFIDPTLLGPNTLPDPRHSGSFRTSGAEWSYTGVYHSGAWSIGVYDLSTLSPTNQFGYFYNPQETVAMFFVPPRVKFGIMYRFGATSAIGALLINSSTRNSEGYGYCFEEEGQDMRVVNTPLYVLQNFIHLTNSRYSTLRGKFVRSQIAESAVSRAALFFNQSEYAFKNKIYDKSYQLGTTGWLEILRGYEDTMNLINNVAQAVAVFFALLIPFSLFFERLVFTSSGFKRLIVSVFIPGVVISVFYFLHPGIQLISSSVMSLIGMVLLSFFIAVLTIFISRAISMARELRVKLLGLHFEKSSVFSSMMETWGSISTLNLKKRRLRTTLNLLMLSITVFSLVSFTSTFLFTTPRPGFVPWNSENLGEIPYRGLYVIRGRERLDNLLTEGIADYLKSSLTDAYVAKRVWLYPSPSLVGGGAVDVSSNLCAQNGQYPIKAVLGLDKEELDIGVVSSGLIRGIWFDEYDYTSCILVDQVAEKLGVDVGDSITFGGIKLKVKGILDGRIINSKVDLDTMTITPWNPSLVSLLRLSPGAQGMEDQYTPLPWESVLIVPSKLASDLGGYVRSVAVKYEDLSTLEKVAQLLALDSYAEVYVSSGKEINYYSRYTFYTFQGWQTLIVPMAIGALAILSTMLANVSERMNEFKIYSSLGLSPLGMASQFLVEVLVVAIISSMIGYLFGIAINGYLITSNFLPPDFIMNTSSVSVLLTIGFSLLAALVSAAYPALKASRLITPSLERKWKPTTKPVGDKWFVPLPFSVVEPNEVKGVFNYLAEYFRAYLDTSTETFITRGVELKDDTLLLKVDLLPIESHLSQDVYVVATKEADRYNFSLDINRISGSRIVWRSSNLRFIDAFRKQLLMWRALKPEERARYIGV